MTRFAVDLDELDAVIADMATFDERLNTRLAELDDMVAELHGVWTGAAADTQRQAHANYSAAAEANARMWSQTR